MDFSTLAIVGILGGAAWLYFTRSSALIPAVSKPLTPTSTMPSVAASPVSTISAPAQSSAVVNPGTVMTVAPPPPPPRAVRRTNIPSDLELMMHEIPQAENQKWAADPRVETMLSSMRLNEGANDNCSGYSPTSPMTFAQLGLTGGATAVGITASILGPASAAAAAVPFIGAAIGVVALIQGIFSHHAAAVKRQAQIDCAATAAANNALNEIDAALASGQFTAEHAREAWESVYQQFQSYVGPLSNDAPGKCNAPCGFTHILRAIIDKYEAMYGV
jgi:hypothetical protein